MKAALLVRVEIFPADERTPRVPQRELAAKLVEAAIGGKWFVHPTGAVKVRSVDFMQGRRKT